MGLDMYLSARKYVPNKDWHDFKKDNPEYKNVLEAVGATGYVEPDTYSGIMVQVPIMYWRKANAIHRWFVVQCQGWVDECQETYIDRSQLVTLRDLCRQILDGSGKADEILPTQSGFFFGGTEYDDWYTRYLKYTADRLDEVLRLFPEEGNPFWEFVYQASW